MKQNDYDEAVEEKMIAKGLGEKDSHDEEHVRMKVLNYFDAKIYTEWNDDLDWFIYEESTCDGYSVWISKARGNAISVNEDVHYYEDNLSDDLVFAITEGSSIYIEDEYANYVEDAIQELFAKICSAELTAIHDLDELIGHNPDTNQ